MCFDVFESFRDESRGRIEAGACHTGHYGVSAWNGPFNVEVHGQSWPH